MYVMRIVLTIDTTLTKNTRIPQSSILVPPIQRETFFMKLWFVRFRYNYFTVVKISFLKSANIINSMKFLI